MKTKEKIISNRGNVLILIIVLTGVFLLIISSLLGVVFQQKKLNNILIARLQALHIAEAGINYYRWHLAHDPTDFTDGTNNPGPYVHQYQDPTTGIIGSFSLEITPPPIGSTIVTIKSTGWINKYPNVKKTIEVKYGKASLAHFSFLSNSDVWLGENEGVSGEMHSNGGIRIDGTNDSLITSAKSTYICTPSHGCNYEEKPGVWGAGPNNDLWKFPVPEIDFNTITIDLANIKSIAQTNGHYYNGSNYGYHLIFLNNGSYDLYRVTSLKPSLYQIDDDDFSGYEYKAEEINTQTYVGNFSLPTNGVIFIEDDVWVEGIVKGNIILVSADFPDNPNTNTSIYINGNINYVERDDTNRLGLIAQKNIQVPRHAPSNLNIDAIMLAQKGRVYRAYYYNSRDRRIKNYIEVYGGIITNKTWTWTWVNSSNNVIDGYQTTKSIYDSKLTYSPPPYFPTTGDYTFISWEELPN